MYNFRHKGLFFSFLPFFSALVFLLPFVTGMTVLTQRGRTNEKIDENVLKATVSSEIVVVFGKIPNKQKESGCNQSWGAEVKTSDFFSFAVIRLHKFGLLRIQKIGKITCYEDLLLCLNPKFKDSSFMFF